MISSLLHRLNLVEHTLNGNAQLLSELQLLEFEAEPCQRDAHAGRDLHTLSNFLRRLEPLLERSTDRLHLLAGAVISQRTQLADIKALSAYRALPGDTRSVDTRLGDPSAVDAFLPSDKALSAAARSFTQRCRLLPRRDFPTDDLTTSSECTGVDARCCHLGNHQRSMDRTPGDGCESQHGCAGGVRVPGAAGGFDCAPREGGCNAAAAGLGVDGTEIVAEMLEAELQKQETVIHRMMRCNETLANKEQEYERKNEWYEHKMRLLKQDKRKRGETIGKLLRCIDDMRDTPGGGGGGGMRVTDDYTVSADDRADQGIGRGVRLDGRGGGGGAGWVDDAFRDVFQELQDEHRVRLRENVSLETCRPDDHGFGFDDDKGRQGIGSDEDRIRFGLGSDEDKGRFGLGSDEDRSRFGLGSDEDRSRFGLGSDEDRSRFGLGSDEDRSRFGLGSDETGNRLGLDRQQKQPSDFIVRHFPLLLTRSTGKDFLPPLGKDADSRNGKELSSGQFPFAQ